MTLCRWKNDQTCLPACTAGYDQVAVMTTAGTRQSWLDDRGRVVQRTRLTPEGDGGHSLLLTRRDSD